MDLTLSFSATDDASLSPSRRCYVAIRLEQILVCSVIYITMSTAIGMCNTSSNSQQLISERRREFNTGLVLEKNILLLMMHGQQRCASL